jgi:hypothetical protein
MSTFTNRYREATAAAAERRLRDAQLDLVRPVVTVQGVAALLREINPAVAQTLPDCVSADEFEHLVLWLEQAGQDLQGVLDTLATRGQTN